MTKPKPKPYPLSEGEFAICCALIRVDHPLETNAALVEQIDYALKHLRERRGVKRLPKGATEFRRRLWDHAQALRDAVPVQTTASALLKAARRRHPYCGGWYRRDNRSRRRLYHCNICDETICTESSGWQQTQTTKRALDAHAADHLDAMEAVGLIEDHRKCAVVRSKRKDKDQ